MNKEILDMGRAILLFAAVMRITRRFGRLALLLFLAIVNLRWGSAVSPETREQKDAATEYRVLAHELWSRLGAFLPVIAFIC